MSENKKISKKQEVVNYLLSEISKGNLKIGDQIPSELELTKKFNFGRQTIHTALSDLALQGVITRTPGKGSYVSSPSVNRNIQKKKSFTEDMHSVGMTPGSKLLEFKIISAKEHPEVALELKVEPNESIYLFTRLRTGNATPIALQYTYIPTKFIEDFDLSALNHSLDKYIETLGFEITGFVTKLRAVTATSKQQKILGSKDSAVLNSISIRYIEDKVPFQYTSTFYRSDLYEYIFSSFN